MGHGQGKPVTFLVGETDRCVYIIPLLSHLLEQRTRAYPGTATLPLTCLGVISSDADNGIEIPKPRLQGGLLSQVGQVSPGTRTKSYFHDHVYYRVQSDGESSGLRPQKIKDFITVIEREIAGKPVGNATRSAKK